MGRLRRAPAGAGADAAAGTVLRLAVLLQAGVAPAAAWRWLADTDPAAAAVCASHDAGTELPAAIAGLGGAWVDIAAAWRVATTVGAPLAESLRAVAEALRDAHAAADDVRIALAEPAATARLLLWLPVFALLLGAVLGFDTIGVLFGSLAGAGCLIVGLALVAGARAWTARLVRRARPAAGIPGLHAELMAIALAGGVSIARARELVPAPHGEGDDAVTDDVLALSSRAGVPAVGLLRASAAHARQAARTRGRLAAARLGSRLLLPLGICTLPAFVLLGVAPLMLAVLATTPLSP